jgi:hypothetical protein
MSSSGAFSAAGSGGQQAGADYRATTDNPLQGLRRISTAATAATYRTENQQPE